MCTMGCGWILVLKISCPSPLYMRCSMGSWSAFSSATGKYSSMRATPSNPMFWVISTALVLHGVIISLRGPTKQPFRFSSLSGVASPNSQQSFWVSSALAVWFISMAITLLEEVLKNKIIYSGYITCYNFLTWMRGMFYTLPSFRAQSYIKAVVWERVDPFFLRAGRKMCVYSVNRTLPLSTELSS